MQYEGWSQEDEDVLAGKEMDADAREWLRQWLITRTGVHAVAVELRRRVVEILLESGPDDFVLWCPSGRYCGRGFEMGAWEINATRFNEAVCRATETAKREAAAAADAPHHASLEAWLRADLTGALAYKGDAGGASRLSAATRQALMKQKRSLKRPRVCRSCKSTFTPKRQYNQATCCTCLNSRRLSKQSANRNTEERGDAVQQVHVNTPRLS
ncbi:MAG: hypothetical protein K2Q09_09900 [Phycisphaerales bacterium]|nr:hypothetical protein [Phycisphaerales bacterium]